MSKILWLILFPLMITACTGKTPYKRLEWSDQTQGEHQKVEFEKVLKKIDTIEQSRFYPGSQKESVEWATQEIQGLPVLNSWIKIGRNKSEDIQFGGLNYIRHSKTILLPPSFNSQEETYSKVQKLLRERFGLSENTKIRAALIAEPKGLRPVWQFFHLEPDYQLYEYLLDGFELNVLKKAKQGSDFFPIPAIVFPTGPKRSQLQEVRLFNLKAGEQLSNQNLKVYSATGEKIIVEGQPLIFSTKEDRFNQVQAFFSLQRANQWFKTHLGWTWAGLLQVETALGHPDRTNAAFYFRNKIRLGLGDGETYEDIPQDPSIVVHESVHALVDRLARLPFQGEGGSINEAYADFITACHLDNPKLGEAAYKLGPFKRNIENEDKWNQLNGVLYGDSLVVSGLFWQLRKEIGQPATLRLVIETLRRTMPDESLESFSQKLRQTARLQLAGEQWNQFNKTLNDRGWPTP